MSHRYLFLCPDRKSASGGIAVIYDLVALLKREGIDAAVVHNSAQAGYPDHKGDVPLYFTERMNAAGLPMMASRRKRMSMMVQAQLLKVRGGALNKVSVRKDDVIVAPEFQLAEALVAFPEQRICVFVQNPFSLMWSFSRAMEHGHDPRDRVSHWFGMSEVCKTHMEMLQIEKASFFPVSMKPEDFTFQSEARPLITYMPRKRPNEAKLIVDALRRRGNVDEYDIEALDGLPRDVVAQKMSQSRIFISLLHNESLGFPAAEAMASGCVVTGFDGLGGAEFFNADTGFPIVEGDVAAVVSSVEKIAAQFEVDAKAFDVLLTHASQTVRDRYSVDAFEQGVLSAWIELNQSLNG